MNASAPAGLVGSESGLLRLRHLGDKAYWQHPSFPLFLSSTNSTPLSYCKLYLVVCYYLRKETIHWRDKPLLHIVGLLYPVVLDAALLTVQTCCEGGKGRLRRPNIDAASFSLAERAAAEMNGARQRRA